MKNAYIYPFLYLFIFSSFVYSAGDTCRTVTPEIDYLENMGIQQYVQNPTSKTFSVYVHIIRHSNGHGGITNQEVDDWLEILHDDYLTRDIFFEEVGRDYIKNDTYYYFNNNQYENLIQENAHDDAIDIYFLGNATLDAANLARAADIPSTAYAIGLNYLNTHIISHEMGHCLGLYHTHEWRFGKDYDGTDCENKGDKVCDTWADAGLHMVEIENCVINTSSYPDPPWECCPPVENIMSYAPPECMEWFTEGQFSRCHTVIENSSVLQNAYFYISAPSNLTWSNVANSPYLSWNSVNHPELIGYNVYRSFDNNSYSLVASVNPSTTYYLDNSVEIGNPKYSSYNANNYVTALHSEIHESFHSNIISVPTNQIQMTKSRNSSSLNDTWTLTDSTEYPRWQHTATLLMDGRVLITGGYATDSQIAYKNCEIYDPVSKKWSEVAPMNIGRYSHSAVLMGDGKVMVSGGATIEATTNSCELYDPVENRWEFVAPMNDKREGHVIVKLDNNKISVSGGYEFDIATGLTHNSCEIYDPNENHWEYSASMNKSKGLHSAVILKDGRIFVAGSALWGQTVSYEIYDPDLNIWTLLDSPYYPPYPHSYGPELALVDDDKVLHIGDTLICETYNLSLNQWEIAGTLNLNRASSRIISLDNGNVLVSGGNRTCELYIPSSNLFVIAADLPAEITSHSLTKLTDGRVLLVGGISSGISNKCYIYEPDSTFTGIENNQTNYSFELKQNYPNPFNPTTTISYSINEKGFVQLKVYDVLGKEIAVLVNEEKRRGNYSVKFNGNNLPSGVYFYTLRVNNFVQSRKMILLR